MPSYEPVDLSAACNAGVEVLSDEPGDVPLGRVDLRGLPFLIGPEPPSAERRWLLPVAPTSVGIGRLARRVIVAHRLLEPGAPAGHAVGQAVAEYAFHLAGGEVVTAPIRERFEIQVVPPGWGRLPFLAVTDTSDHNLPRFEGRWGEAGMRLTEHAMGWPAGYFLWCWENPHPERQVERIEFIPSGPRFLVAGVTTSDVDEHPFVRAPARPVRIVAKDRRDGVLDIEVDRGVATYPQPLPGEDDRAGWGATAGKSAYTSVAALPSATVAVRQGDTELGRVRWGDVERDGRADAGQVTLELVEDGRNWVHVSVVDDATGRPVPCRVHFRSADGIPYQPHGHHNHVTQNLGSWHYDVGGDIRLGQRSFAYIDGTCQGWLPRGDVVVDVARGFEYEPLRQTVRIEPGQRDLTLRIGRVADMASEGWWSGDSHVHFLSTPGAQLEQKGEDLRVVNVLQTQWGALFTNTEDFSGRPSVSQPSVVDSGGYVTYIGQDPDDASRYVVASSLGLHSHSGASTQDETWPRVAVDPFDIGDGPNDYQVISDVVWVPRHDGDPSRLFVAWSDKGVWMSENGTAGPFEKVSLLGSVDGRLGLAMAPSNPGTVYVLGQGPKLWRIRMTPDGPEADRIDRVPKNLFGVPPKDQSDYDLAVAVDPADSRLIVLGGAAAMAEGEWNAALVRCRVSDDDGGPKLDWDPRNDAEDLTAKPSRTFEDDPTWVGLGVHADIHALRYVEGDPSHELWIACDGGLFRSRAAAGTSAGDRGTFVAVNSGLGVLQPGYVASHPVNDVSMAAGTQDNGTIVRVGVGTWAMYGKGDGGGVVFHPGVPDVLAYQYTGASWRSKVRWSNPVWRWSTDTVTVPSERAEDSASSFYSGVAVFRRPDGTVRLAVGTNRVWLSDNWNPAVAGANSWVTLPHGKDPRAARADDISTDVRYDDSDGTVVALRWLSEKRLLVLMRRAVLVYRQTEVDKWLVDVISDKGTKCNSTVSDDSITSPSDYLPPVEGCEFSDIAVHDADQGARGSFYVATTSTRDYPHMDTLWWFDGGLKWYRTGLRDEGVPAPAYAVAVDHTPGGDTGVVYVGTGTGVWRGEYVPAGGADPPDWSWTRLDNGLPEAAVQDLTVERFGDRLLLRVALQSRGVWELELQGPAAPKTYLQSAAFDGRRGASSSAATQFPTADPFTPMSSSGWFESPDVQVRTVPGVVPPLPALPTNESNWYASQRALWQFQVALHNVDPTCRPVGQWTALFGRRLEAYRRAHKVGANRVPDALLQVIDADVWGQVMVPGNVFAPMWDGLEATEADLLELVRRDRLFSGITRILPGLANVDVLVHHRDSRPVAASDVRVTLLRRAVTALPADWDALRLEADACAALVGALTTNAPPAMPAPWAYADLGTAVRHPNSDVDARSPRPVTFRIDAGALGARTLLLAAVSVGGSEVIATSAGLVRDLVRADHHLAARIIQAV